MVAPKGTLASLPSMFTVTRAPMASGLVVVTTRRCCCDSGARWMGVVGLLMLTPSSRARRAGRDLVAEVLQHREEGARAGLPEAALRSDLHGGAERLDALEVLRGARAVLEELDALEQLGVAQPARRALAARLLDEELEEVLGHVEEVTLRPDHHDGTAGRDVLEGEAAG